MSSPLSLLKAAAFSAPSHGAPGDPATGFLTACVPPLETAGADQSELRSCDAGALARPSRSSGSATDTLSPAAHASASRVPLPADIVSATPSIGDIVESRDATETAPQELSECGLRSADCGLPDPHSTCDTPPSAMGRPPEVVPSEAEARGLLATYLKTNLRADRGSMTAAARIFAHSEKCGPDLREAILREQGPARASKHQLPVTVKRAMHASQALVTYSRNPRDADVMFGHARVVLRRHWSEDRRLYAGEAQSSDDGTINFVVCVPWPWGGCRCSNRFGVKVGRFQWLPTCDHASDYIPGFTFAIRPSGAYRAEDVCAAMGRLWRDTCKPAVAVLERGIWESHRVTALLAAAGVDVGRSYAPRQKLVEGVFSRLWTVLSVMPGQVGRYRGEMERENKLLAAAQAGTLDPREHFVDLALGMTALEEATRFHNRTPIESKQYGKWIPETRWREDLAAHAREALDPSFAYLWAPEVRTWTVRRACVGGMVEQPLGVTLPAHWWAPALLDCEGRKVTAHFDPWEQQSPATLTLTEDWPQRAWKAGRILAAGVPCLEDLPAIARDASDSLAVHMGDGDGTCGANERAKQMRSTLRAIVLREYRVLAADGTRARRETEVRAPSARSAEARGDGLEARGQTTAPAPITHTSRLAPEDDLAELARIEALERRHAPAEYQPL